MKISIIVPAFNEEKLLPATLRSIQESSSSFKELRWENELIVCDNNSTDRTAALGRAAGAAVVFEPVNQIARARNTGARTASGDWLIFVDADSQPTPALFAEVAEQIQSGPCVAGGVVLRFEGHYPIALRLAKGWNYLSRALHYVAGSFIFCETRAFRELGGFDERLFASEEIEFSRRLKRFARARGRKIVILHRHPLLTSARKLHLYTPWEYFRFLVNTVLTGKRNLRRRDACGPWYDGRR